VICAQADSTGVTNEPLMATASQPVSQSVSQSSRESVGQPVRCSVLWSCGLVYVVYVVYVVYASSMRARVSFGERKFVSLRQRDMIE
jgi:hypothetical protein